MSAAIYTHYRLYSIFDISIGVNLKVSRKITISLLWRHSWMLLGKLTPVHILQRMLKMSGFHSRILSLWQFYFDNMNKLFQQMFHQIELLVVLTAEKLLDCKYSRHPLFRTCIWSFLNIKGNSRKSEWELCLNKEIWHKIFDLLCRKFTVQTVIDFTAGCQRVSRLIYSARNLKNNRTCLHAWPLVHL
jgi:hypothetical protein